MRKKSEHPATPERDPAAAQEDDFTVSPFYAALVRALAGRGMRPEALCDAKDGVERRLLAEYGAMFIADASLVRVPPRCVFRSEEECERFQAEVEPRAALIADARIELQPAALDALLAARAEAHAHGLEITPRGGAEAARRSYADTLRLWESRVTPALAYWVSANALAPDEAERLGSLCCAEQIAAVLQEEERGNFFSKDFSRTILSSVAAPGASQHLAMLAFDATEFRDERVREILARHGWFQTVLHDLPHFTFLGVREKELRALGLKRVVERGQNFWIPNI
ncbi:MAG TPA: hypothetical protein VEZ40_13985 [Pyrinomonadaceae bacterium]|nr:hypothetical protein [Pyrinomonadaceae bacterium]